MLPELVFFLALGHYRRNCLKEVVLHGVITVFSYLERSLWCALIWTKENPNNSNNRRLCATQSPCFNPCCCIQPECNNEMKSAGSHVQFCFYPPLFPSVCGHCFGLLVFFWKFVSSVAGLTLTWARALRLWAFFGVKSPLGWIGLRPSSQTYSKQL